MRPQRQKKTEREKRLWQIRRTLKSYAEFTTPQLIQASSAGSTPRARTELLNAIRERKLLLQRQLRDLEQTELTLNRNWLQFLKLRLRLKQKLEK